ncbi:hypothetical protein A3Q56_02892 [Intoshia linei]|uniref:Spermatogenesis-defective protein 39 n=1 Tax=Intoshia linei TaxID=1819745 RepID=A0A177B514_9BILA|nr:hypothetical protein A3Q56_02892 [Intoshia linei]
MSDDYWNASSAQKCNDANMFDVNIKNELIDWNGNTVIEKQPKKSLKVPQVPKSLNEKVLIIQPKNSTQKKIQNTETNKSNFINVKKTIKHGRNLSSIAYKSRLTPSTSVDANLRKIARDLVASKYNLDYDSFENAYVDSMLISVTTKEDALALLEDVCTLGCGDSILTVILHLKKIFRFEIFVHLIKRNQITINLYISHLDSMENYVDLFNFYILIGRRRDAFIMYFYQFLNPALMKNNSSYTISDDAINTILTIKDQISSFSKMHTLDKNDNFNLKTGSYSNVAFLKITSKLSSNISVSSMSSVEPTNKEFKCFTNLNNSISIPQTDDYLLLNMINQHHNLVKWQHHTLNQNDPEKISKVLFNDHSSVLDSLYTCNIQNFTGSASSLANIFKISKQQNCWVTIKLHLHRSEYDEIEKMFKKKSIFNKFINDNVITIEDVAFTLFEVNAPSTVIMRFCSLIPNVQSRLEVAERLECFEIIIQIYLDWRDRQSIVKLLPRLRKGSYALDFANNTISNKDVRWKN